MAQWRWRSRSRMPRAVSSRNVSDRTPPRVLVYGYGNPGRQDDGAGVALVEELEAELGGRGRGALSGVTFDTGYQLNAEDALAASQNDVVIFVDASRDTSERFCFRAISPAPTVSFSTHAM